MTWHPETCARKFWAKVDTSAGPEACWPWTGYIRRPPSLPYGWSSLNNHGMTAHRVAWIRTFGPIESSQILVCHTCDNPPCVNPAHLFLGSPAMNSADMVTKGRASKHGNPSLYTERKFTDDDVRLIRARLNAGERGQSLAEEFGVTRRTIWLIGTRGSYARVA